VNLQKQRIRATTEGVGPRIGDRRHSTHMRPSLASDLTRSLLEVEGLAADRIVVVVNGVGGLDDPVLESRVRMVRLPENIVRRRIQAGMIEAFSDSTTRWPTSARTTSASFHFRRPPRRPH